MRRTITALVVTAAMAGAARAQDAEAPAANPVAQPATSGAQGAPDAPASIQSSLGRVGDPGGIRAALDAKGIDYGLTYIGETLGNTSGGVKRGATYEGRVDVTVDVDAEKLFNLKGLAIHAEGFQIHGRGLTGNNTLDLFTVSNIEAFPSTRLYEAWAEQKFADNRIVVRAGQLAADTEFFVSQTATLFINSTYGSPALLANDLPSGGPTYPLASPGVRVKVTPVDNFTVLAAVFDGDPSGPYQPGANEVLPQLRNRNGTNFRLKDPPLLMTEAAYAYNQNAKAATLPGTVKVGYIHHFENFAVLDAPDPVNARGNDFVYGIIDQTIYRIEGTTDQGASAFFRVGAGPSDRNPIDVYIDGGVSFKGIFPGRPDDTFGVAAAYARSSPNLARADAQTPGALVHDYSALIEATYQFAVMPGFTIQPDFQYLFHPGNNAVPDPADGLPIRDAAVFGVRATVHY